MNGLLRRLALLIGLVIGWRLATIVLEQSAPRLLTAPPAAPPPLPPATVHAHRPPATVEREAAPEANAAEEALPEMEAYCLSCREQRPMTGVRHETAANGRAAVKGECAVCGRTLFRFIKES